jgi:predicted P-loop ATPase
MHAKEKAPVTQENATGAQETETDNYSQGTTELTAAPLSLTLFLGSETNTTPTEHMHLGWACLEDTLQRLTVPGPKGSAGYVVAGIVTGNRCEDNTGPATALVVDYEPPGAADWDSWPCDFVAHTTASHDPTGVGERWRVFLRLVEDIPADRYKQARRAIEADLPPGSKIRGRSQPAFLPTREDTQYETHTGAGGLDWRLLLASAPVGGPLVVGERSVGEAPDPALVARLLDQWVRVWPETNRHDASFALGGLLARGSWPDDVCLAFAEQILFKTDSNVEDGLECVELSLDRVGDGETVYGFPTLLGLLRLPEGIPTSQRSAVLTTFLESFVEAMKPPAPPPAPAAVVTYEGDPPRVDPRDEALATWSAHPHTHPKTGKRLANSWNAELTFENHPSWSGVFAWDEFASKVAVLRDGPNGSGIRAGEYWSPDNGGVFAIQVWFTAKMFDEFSKTLLIDAIHREAGKHRFHPVRKYLDELPLWDGVDRNLSTYLGAEQTEYHRAVCGAWLRSAVARVMQPGCQADSILVLEGRQGARKSTALRYLCPDVRHFLVVRSDIRSKDFLSNMRGRWIAEFAEVDKLIGSRDASELKDILSTTIDTYRKAYGVDDLAYPRQLVFAGTTNPDENGYLKDTTGNRRYWVVACGELIDTNVLLRDRDQIWAQAYTEYLLGTPWWLDGQMEAVAAGEAAERLESDDWETVIEGYRAELTALEDGFTTLDALGKLPGAIPVAQIDQKHTRRMAKVLRKLGFEFRQRRLEGGRVKRWTAVSP